MNKIEFGDCRETMRRWKDQGVNFRGEFAICQLRALQVDGISTPIGDVEIDPQPDNAVVWAGVPSVGDVAVVTDGKVHGVGVECHPELYQSRFGLR